MGRLHHNVRIYLRGYRGDCDAIHLGPGSIRVVESGQFEIVGGHDRLSDRCRQLAAGT